MQKLSHNRFNRMEWAGAFGDLGTLIPFIIGYITILKLDPLGVLFMFGILMIFSGFYYKTPIPVQPMKAIGGAAITQAAVTPGMVWGAGIFTGLFWLILSWNLAFIMARCYWGTRFLLIPAAFGMHKPEKNWIKIVFVRTWAELKKPTRKYTIV